MAHYEAVAEAMRCASKQTGLLREVMRKRTQETPMPMILGLQDTHLVGKILEQLTDEDLFLMGLTPAELVRAEGLWEDLEEHLEKHVGPNWDQEEVQ